ncbi:hypothetical protein ACSBR2_030335 [Camellia fascicularis]
MQRMWKLGLGMVLGSCSGWIIGGVIHAFKERNGDAKHHDSEPPTPHSLIKMGSRECSNMEHPNGTLASVTQCIEQLGQNSSSVQEQE